LKKYLSILADKKQFPIVFDAQGTILSWPPIINSEHSKITLETRNVFIECTATDLTKAHIVLNTIVTLFSQYCAKPFTVEPVAIQHTDGRREISPRLENRELEVTAEYIQNRIGISLSLDHMVTLLERMGLTAVALSDDKKLQVTVPPTRSDILHACDVMEDVAIGYGFNNIRPTLPHTNTIGQAFALNRLSDMLRHEMAQAGYSEVLTLSLVSNLIGVVLNIMLLRSYVKFSLYTFSFQ
jgi:phenylalanyl-tRNA synthetase beta chain